MATVGVGIDLVDVARFRLALERHPRIVERLFTDDERRDARARPERLAARFAAKEAVMKTFKVGVGSAPWRSIEVTLDDAGAPSVLLHAPTRELARSLGVTNLHLSMTHTDQTAAAIVVGSSSDESRGR
ncbi:MAG: holo-ACP synthase [Acidimicrobiales bacterium]